MLIFIREHSRYENTSIIFELDFEQATQNLFSTESEVWVSELVN